MRRIFIHVLTAAALASAPLAVSASGFGVRAAMEVSVPGGPHDAYRTGAGLSIGAVYRIPVATGIYIEPGLHGFYMAMSTDKPVLAENDMLYDGAARVYGLSIPLFVGFEFPMAPKWDMGVATGPLLNINLSARQALVADPGAPVEMPSGTVNLFRHGWNRVDAAWGLRLSFIFAKSYFVGITTGVAFTPLASYGNKDKKIRIHRNTVAIALGYNF